MRDTGLSLITKAEKTSTVGFLRQDSAGLPAAPRSIEDTDRHEVEGLRKSFVRWSTQAAILVREPYPSLFSM